jgi:hypothetical protein
MGDYKILCGRLLSEKTAVETYNKCSQDPTHRIRLRPAHSFLRVDTKKSGPELHMNSAAVQGHGLKHFYFRGMLILKIVALKRLIGKI